MVASYEVLCTICLEEASEHCERTVVTLKCSHKFHLDCIGTSFNYRGIMQCPNCRAVENGEWQQSEHNNPPNNVVNDHVLSPATENQGPEIQGSPIDGVPREQPSSEYDNVNYSMHFGAGSPLAHGPHFRHHNIVHCHHINIYSGISPATISLTSGSHSSMPPSSTSFGDTFLNSHGFDNQTGVFDHPQLMAYHNPPTMGNETISINLNNTPPQDANPRTPSPELSIHLDGRVHSQANSQSHTYQGNDTIRIITISDDEDGDDDSDDYEDNDYYDYEDDEQQIITISDDE